MRQNGADDPTVKLSASWAHPKVPNYRIRAPLTPRVRVGVQQLKSSTAKSSLSTPRRPTCERLRRKSGRRLSFKRK